MLFTILLPAIYDPTTLRFWSVFAHLLGWRWLFPVFLFVCLFYILLPYLLPVVTLFSFITPVLFIAILYLQLYTIGVLHSNLNNLQSLLLKYTAASASTHLLNCTAVMNTVLIKHIFSVGVLMMVVFECCLIHQSLNLP